MVKRKSITYNYLMNLILTVSNVIFPLITFPYVSRVLHATANGKIAFASSTATYFSMLACLGIPTYGIRACAEVRDSRAKLSKTVYEILTINLLAMTVVIVAYILFIIFVPKFYNERVLFFINGINIILNVLGVNWLYQALEKYDYITIRSLIFKIIGIALMFVFVHQESDYIIYAFITVFASIGSNICNFVQIRKYVEHVPISTLQLGKHLKPIMVLFAQNIAVYIYINLDTVMLGFMKSDYDVGIYNASVKVKLILVSIVTALGNVLLPRMSYYVKNSLYNEFKELMYEALNFTIFMSLPLTMFFITTAKDSIFLLAGREYADAILPMRIITFAVIAIGITNILGVQVLTAIGKEKYVLVSVTIGAITDLLLNSIWIPKYSSAGAALSTTIAEYMVLIVQLLMVRRLIAFEIAKVKMLRYVISVIPSITITLLASRSLHFHSFFNLLVEAIIFGGIYLAIMIFIKDKYLNLMINILRTKIMRKDVDNV